MSRQFIARMDLVLMVCFLMWSAFQFAALAAEHDVDREGVTFASEHLRFTAFFDNTTVGGSVLLRFSDGREITLPQAISASGARYFDGTTLFWNKGDEATVTWEGATYEVRVIDPDTDPWELAKKDGVKFRAIGQEPGWLLDIRDDYTLFLLLDYGDTQITTPLATEENHYWTGTKTYRTSAPWSPLDITVTVRAERCYDAMSGEGFTSSVTVQFDSDGPAYRGCGRQLIP